MLVEREALIGRLHAAQAAAAAGTGRVVAVSGEAGAGKSALVSAAFDSTAGWGYCEPLVPPRPLTPWRDLARAYGQSLTDDPHAALLDLLQLAPRVVVVEDAHWIDDASAHVLRFLARRVHASPSLIVVTYRDELGADHPLHEVLAVAGVERLAVPPLTPDGVQALLADSGLDAEEAYRLTRGNALLVTQLAPGEPGGVAPTVRDVVGARLARLPATVRPLVELLSVVPGRADPAQLGLTWAELDPALRAGLLEADGAVVRFRHELVRLAVEQGLDPGARIERHAEVLRRLDSSGGADPAVVAFHARGAHQRELAFQSEVAAAQAALDAASFREAGGHYQRALADVPASVPPERACRLWLACSNVEFHLGHDEPARAAAEAAAAACPDDGAPELRGELLAWRSRVAAGERDQLRLAGEAVALLEPLGPSVALARARAREATVLMLGRQLAKAAVVARQALATAPDAEAEVVALQALGGALTLSGADPQCTDLRRAVERARAAGLEPELSRAYSNLVSAAGEERLYAVSDAAAREALKFFLGRDIDAWARYTRAWHARCLFEQGKWSPAAALADAVLADQRFAVATIAALCVRGRVRARRGDPNVWDALDEAKRHADRIGALQRLAPVAAARAEARWLTGTPDDGTDGLAAAYELACELANPWATGELGFWMWRHDLLHTLPDFAAAAYRLQVDGNPAAAASAWAELGCPYEQADALSDGGDEQSLRAALDLLTALGAGPLRSRVTRRLRELGVRSIPRGPREYTATTPDGLTEREDEVLRWVRNGHTDAEIAAALHLSVRTVGHHVSAVLRKTGTSSRRELQRRQPR